MTNDSAVRLAAFRQAFRDWRGDATSHRPFGEIYLGCETRMDPAAYRWDGMHRGADPRHPRILFQATLTGAGCFERGSQRWTVGPETAFLAILPSQHLYYLPAEVAEWSFFWFTYTHPYVVRRLSRLAERAPPVFPFPAESPFAAQCLAFFERNCHKRFADHFAEEGALLDWMLELERHRHDLAHPRDRRDAMLWEVRQLVQDHFTRSIGIEEIARKFHLSRSHFSHRFRAATGLAPAAYVMDIRLAEVCRCLRETAAPLKDLASQTGFADANHLCKAFRRRYHLSPGAYRRQVRP